MDKNHLPPNFMENFLFKTICGRKSVNHIIYTISLANSKINFEKVTELVLKINEDQFMKSSVIGLNVLEDEKIILQLTQGGGKLRGRGG